MKLTPTIKQNIKSTYEIVRGLILMTIVILLGLAITTGTADAETDKGIKPSQEREWGVKSINIDTSFAIDKFCIKYYDNPIKFDSCVKNTKSIIQRKYKELDKTLDRKQNI